MTIGVATPIYNEEYLLPIFLEHYKFADEIIFFYDTDTTDRSLEVIHKHKKTNVIIQPYNTGDGMNDYYMIDLLHEKLKYTTMDYTICVDGDELLFHTNKNFETLGEDIKNYISKDLCDYYLAAFFHMLPDSTEERDITPDKPIWEQRKYGWFEDTYLKPCIIKKDSKLEYSIGKHWLIEDGKHHSPVNQHFGIECMGFQGCHLNNVNEEIAIQRRIINRCTRLSKVQRERGAGSEYFDLTEEKIREGFRRKTEKLW